MSTQLPWEIGGESWGYWFFAKQLVGGSGFLTPDRSPLYTVYLAPFLGLPYPISTTIEGFVSTCICALSVFYFLRWQLGSLLAGLFSILWIPFFQQFEPATQALGLACVCLAFGVRLRSEDANRKQLIGVSYALILAATLFRPNYVVYLFTLFAYDLWSLRREERSTTGAFVEAAKYLLNWPFVALIALAVTFTFFQNPHPWNNVWLCPIDWIPGNSHSLGATSVMGHFNWRYIELKYGSFEGKDIYFTNQEAFAGATSIAGMIQANPTLFAKIIAINIKSFFIVSVFNFQLPTIPHVQGWLSLLLFLVMCYGAIRAATNKLLLTYVVSTLIIVFLTSLSYPKVRYMFPVVPVIALSAWWYGTKLAVAAAHGINRLWVFRGITIAVLLLFSVAPLMQWLNPERVSSMKAAFPELKGLASGCKGIMSMESLYFGAFVIDNPEVNNFDIMEIPPFGNYGSSVYKGLATDRVDCLFISSLLESSVGMGTNIQIRYQNYIKPYEKYLVSIGAESHLIPHYGRVIKWTTAKSD